jgi:predicted DCC family thiol-disulfide oxidoreductase YuxK
VKKSQDTLYFDDSCPICSAEMRRLARLHDEGLELLPISSVALEEREALRSELHLKTEQGVWLKGLEANVRAWQHTRYSVIARLLLHPALRWLAELGYRSWLLWYQWARKRREANG